MDPQILQRIKNCKTLPAIPALPLQVLQMCRDEKADAKKVGDVISKDPSFVAKLLNVANSSFYGGSRHKVATVTQAVTLMGMNSIATLAFCFSLYRDLRKKVGAPSIILIFGIAVSWPVYPQKSWRNGCGS